MVKKIMAILVLAGPLFLGCESKESVFGLRAGMSAQEVAKLRLGVLKKASPHNEYYSHWIDNPRTPEGAFSMELSIGAISGLMSVTVWWRVKTDRHGVEVLKKFNDLRTMLSKKYGEGVTSNKIAPESPWQKSEDWMLSILSKDRTLNWIYTSDDGDIQTIGLSASGEKVNEGLVLLFCIFRY